MKKTFKVLAIFAALALVGVVVGATIAFAANGSENVAPKIDTLQKDAVSPVGMASDNAAPKDQVTVAQDDASDSLVTTQAQTTAPETPAQTVDSIDSATLATDRQYDPSANPNYGCYYLDGYGCGQHGYNCDYGQSCRNYGLNNSGNNNGAAGGYGTGYGGAGNAGAPCYNNGGGCGSGYGNGYNNGNDNGNGQNAARGGGCRRNY